MSRIALIADEHGDRGAGVRSLFLASIRCDTRTTTARQILDERLHRRPAFHRDNDDRNQQPGVLLKESHCHLLRVILTSMALQLAIRAMTMDHLLLRERDVYHYKTSLIRG